MKLTFIYIFLSFAIIREKIFFRTFLGGQTPPSESLRGDSVAPALLNPPFESFSIASITIVLYHNFINAHKLNSKMYEISFKKSSVFAVLVVYKFRR